MHQIQLKHLISSKKNVRKQSETEAQHQELKASIKAHGLIENLAVTQEDDGTYAVIAGQRRLRALSALAEEGAISWERPIPCQLIDIEHATEISLAENFARVAMHPLDEFEAFNRLAGQGLSVKQIATRYGQDIRKVKQRLKLGQVHPEIRQAYREENINLECLIRFTLSDDLQQQLEIFNGFHKRPQAWQVTHHLTNEKIRASHRLVLFVGVEAYRAAGGYVIEDLFADDETLYLQDRLLVEKLAKEKLNQLSAEYKSKHNWQWIEQNMEDTYFYNWEFQELEPANGVSWQAEDYAKAGAVTYIDEKGGFAILEGAIKPEDQKTEATVDESAQKNTYSQSLKDALIKERLAITQAHLATDFNLAFELMLVSLIVACNSNYLGLPPLQIQTYTTITPDKLADMAVTTAEMPKALKGCFDFITVLVEADQYKDQTSLIHEQIATWSIEEKQAAFAYLSALNLRPENTRIFENTTDEKEEEDNLLSKAGGLLEIDMVNHWRPTKDGFWKRISKSHMLEIAEEVLGDDWVQQHRLEKKKDLAEKLAYIFAGEAVPGINATQAAAAQRWLPHGMGYGVDETDMENTQTVEIFNDPETVTQAETVEELPAAFAITEDEPKQHPIRSLRMVH